MSDLPQDRFETIAELAELYLRDEISSDQLAELESLVRSEEDAAQAMRVVLQQAGMLRVVFAEQQQFTDRIGEPDREVDQAMLQGIGPVEEPELVTWIGELPDDPASLSGHDFAVVGRYVLRKVFTDKKLILSGVCSAAAAVLLLALILINPFASDAPEPLATVPDTPTLAPDLPAVVATLTAERGAAWLGAVPSVHDKLVVGQRLTLAEGFAEVTTRQGTVVMLEAPCSIELIDHPNAMRLYDGKLVGVCETLLSKGFLVLTPHMRVTDLGTRFGVVVNPESQTEVHVTSGEVAVDWGASSQAEPVEMLVVAGESLAANQDPASAVRAEADPSLFAVITPVGIPLRGTGVGLAKDVADMDWLIISENGKPVEPAEALRVSHNEGHVEELPNDSRSQWIAWKPSIIFDDDQTSIDYQVQTSIEIPDSVDPATASLHLKVAADNRLAAIIVNGHRVPVQMPGRKSWDALEPFVITEHLKRGENSIVFEVQNISFDRRPAHVVGLRLTWEIHGQAYQIGGAISN